MHGALSVCLRERNGQSVEGCPVENQLPCAERVALAPQPPSTHGRMHDAPNTYFDAGASKCHKWHVPMNPASETMLGAVA